MVKSPPRERLRDPLARKSPPVALVAPGLWEPQDDEVLRLVEVSGELGEVELEEEGHLQAGVDAVHGGELPSCTSWYSSPPARHHIWNLPCKGSSSEISVGIEDRRNKTEERGIGEGSGRCEDVQSTAHMGIHLTLI